MSDQKNVWQIVDHGNGHGFRCNQNIGCVIMASGMAKRFGSNKLLADWDGAPLIMKILASTKDLFAKRVVVTRHKEVEALCLRQGVDVILHDFPNRNDTVRLGLKYLMEQQDLHMTACMFCQSDQPLLTKESIRKMIEGFRTACEIADEEVPYQMDSMDPGKEYKPKIIRLAYGTTVGTPVLFPAWTFQELMHLPQKKGGGYVMKKHSEYVDTVEADSIYELKDVDTPEELEALAQVSDL